MTTRVDVDAHGPLFDGSIHRVVEDWLEEAKREVGDASVNEIQATLGSVLKNPTGYYESRIVTDRQFNDTAVTDSGVVYGPWLEGTSSRNQTTRFKGYATFRRVANRMQPKAHDIAETLLRLKYLSRMQ